MNSNKPNHEQISARAYQIFVERGCPEGRDLEHWLEAEAQLSAETQHQESNPATITGAAPSTAKSISRASAPRKPPGKAAAGARM